MLLLTTQAYRHILNSLQRIDDSLPFQKWLLGEDDEDEIFTGKSRTVRTPASPSYLHTETNYDLTALMDEKYPSYGKEVKVLDKAAWPAPDMLSFDENQVEAVQVKKLLYTRSLKQMLLLHRLA